MIKRVVKMTFQTKEVDSFLKVFNEYKTHIAASPGCHHLELLRSVQNENIFFTYSYWDSETDLNNYRETDLFGIVWKQTKKLFSDKPEAWSVETFDLVKSNK